MEYGSKVIGAILVWLIGSWMIRLLVRMLRKILEKGGSEASLRTFFCESYFHWAEDFIGH